MISDASNSSSSSSAGMSTASGAASRPIDSVSTLNIRSVERADVADGGANLATDTADVQKPVVALPRTWKGTVEAKARSMVDCTIYDGGRVRG